MRYLIAISLFSITLVSSAQVNDSLKRWQTGVDLTTTGLRSDFKSLEIYLEELGQQVSVFQSYKLNARHSIGIGLNMWAKFTPERLLGKRVNYFTYSIQFNYQNRLGSRWDLSIKPFFPFLSYHPINLSDEYGYFWASNSKFLSEASPRERIWGIIPVSLEYHKQPNSPLRWRVGLSMLGYTSSNFHSSLSTSIKVSEFHYFASLLLGVGYRF